MKRCLADVNVLFALLVLPHQHYDAALEWFDRQLPATIGLCRLVQLALIRLLTNPAVLGSEVQSTSAAWNLVAELLQDERVEFIPEPPDLDPLLATFLTHRAPAGKLVNDAYLAAFALASSRRLVTFDRAFRQFPGLNLELLES